MYVYISFQTLSSSQRAPLICRWFKLLESDKTSSELQVFRSMEKKYQIKEPEYALFKKASKIVAFIIELAVKEMLKVA